MASVTTWSEGMKNYWKLHWVSRELKVSIEFIQQNNLDKIDAQATTDVEKRIDLERSFYLFITAVMIDWMKERKKDENHLENLDQ